MSVLKYFPFELISWTGALVLLAFSDPYTPHFSLCPLANLGINWCPGCGLGHSVASLLHGEIKLSISQHWFGIPATGILLHRIWLLSKNLIKPNPLTFNL